MAVREHTLWFQFFLKNYWNLFYNLECDLSCQMYHVNLKGMCFLPLLGVSFYKHHLGKVADNIQIFYVYVDFPPQVQSIPEAGAFNSPAVIGEFSLSPFNFVNSCFIYFEILVWDTCTFRIMLSCWIDHFIIMKSPVFISDNAFGFEICLVILMAIPTFCLLFLRYIFFIYLFVTCLYTSM